MKPASWIHVALGSWLIAAPFVLGYSRVSAGSEDVILGLAVVFVALWEGRALAVPSTGSVIQLMLAAWIFLAPFAMAYVGTFPALINDIGVSALLIVTSVAMITERPIQRLT
jgi:hypothetical protein